MNHLFSAVALSAALLLAASCDKNNNAADIRLSHESADLYINETLLLRNIGGTESLLWSSSDPGVASVDGTGLVTGISKGTAVITASAGRNSQATCTVNVGGGLFIDMSGTDAAGVANNIKAGLNDGYVDFKLSGEFEKIGIPTITDAYSEEFKNNPFYGSAVEVIDFSLVTGWPEVDVDGGLLISDFQTLTLDGVTGMPGMAFKGIDWSGNRSYTNLRKVVLPSSPEMEAIGSEAFINNPKLETVVGESVRIIGNQAFTYNTSMTRAEYPNATTVHPRAFRGTGLARVSLPKVNTLYYGVFKETTLQELILSAVGELVIVHDSMEPYYEDSKYTDDLRAYIFDESMTINCALTLNADKHYNTGTMEPKATSATDWYNYPWKSITFVE